MNKSFKGAVDSFIETASEENMKDLVVMVKSDSVSDNELAYLTERIAASGETFSFEKDITAVDLASTGGPSSLSTLLCPLYLRALGGIVPCLAVPGRPAGGIDVLSLISGYEINLSRERTLDCLSACGYVHIIAGEKYAPRDAELFTFRQKSKYQNVAPLAVVSLLAKKLAMGLNRIGLDVRVAVHGNFGGDLGEARANSEQFCRVADLLNIKAFCFLTNAEIPYQPYIGRGEALVALAHIFADNTKTSLEEHTNLCFEMAKRTMENRTSGKPEGKLLLHHFEHNLVSQGSNLEEFYKRVKQIKECNVVPLISSSDGFLQVNLLLIRSIIVDLQKREITDTRKFADSCGIKLEKTTGDYVSKGELIASVRIEESLLSFTSEIENKFLSSFTFTQSPIKRDEIFEVISNV